MSADFVHLHVHTQYSLLDGACRIKKLCQKAADFGMPALAMTDHGNMFGAVDFYQTAQKNNIKPIIGVEAYLSVNGSRLDKTPQNKGCAHLVLLAKDALGYKNLTKLTSAGFLEGFYYHPRMDKELLAQHAEGLICTSACLKGEVAWHLMHDDFNEALKAADDYQQIFGKDNFYLELMDHGIDVQKKVNDGLLKIANTLNLKKIITNDVHYLEQGQSCAHETLLCIQTQTTLDDPKRMRLHSDQFYFKDPKEMYRQFHWVQDALLNTVEVAERCNLEMEFGKIHLPHFDPPGHQTKEAYLRQLCEEGLIERFGRKTPELADRLEHELKVIEKMGFVAYFLIVWDFINYAKKSGIPVGPGRGSAAGSLVSYLLGITDLNPLKYGLLFERFLNADRAGMPDIDIDFCYERRGEVIEYVTRKYGEKNVAQIITFGTMQAKAAIRDVGRALGASYGDVDKIAKLVPNELGITLEDALEKEPQLKQLSEEDKQAGQIIDTARVLEGLNRHASIHAAGVVISDKELTEYVPLFKTSDGQITTGFTMDGIAKIGLLKMDFLGLRTLTVITKSLDLIKKTKGQEININQIALDDEKTYELLSSANSFGVFQLESAGMRELLKKSKPSEFEDIIAILALYRPGPMGSGMLDDYIKRKRGEAEVEYDHPKLEPILKETYGIILYQEQVMQIPVALAGFTLVQADHLRRAMSKKIKAVMDQMRIDFVAGCQQHSGMTDKKANYIFDLIDYFSGYGFNKSHSAAYALISYQTAFLKANYPVEFMSALLTCERDNTEKVVEYVKEASQMGIKVLAPNINTSFKEFSVVDEHSIGYGLLAVKNVGATAIESIVANRKNGPYTSLFNLCERVDLRLVNRKVLESLIKCGALDDFAAHRSQMVFVLERALEAGARSQKEKASGQMSFFDMGGGNDAFTKNSEALPDLKEWPQAQLLAFEKEILGFYLSGHPLDQYQVEIKEFTDYSTDKIQHAPDGEEIRLVGMISAIKLTFTRKSNERMAIIRLEDMNGEVEAVVFPSAYQELAHYITPGKVVFLTAKVSIRDDARSLVVNNMKHINEVYNAIKTIRLDMRKVNESNFNSLKRKLSSFPGKVPVYLTVNANSQKSVEIRVGEELFVSPNENLMNAIKEIVGKEQLAVTF